MGVVSGSSMGGWGSHVLRGSLEFPLTGGLKVGVSQRSQKNCQPGCLLVRWCPTVPTQ